MIKYAKVINEQTGLCEVGIGTNSKFYKSIGMKEQDVSQSDIDGKWYLSDKCPMKSPEDKLAEAKQAKLNEASNKAFEYRDKTGTVSFDGRPVAPIMPMTEGEEPPATITVHTELLNQDDMFQRVIGFQQGIFTQDQIYNTKEDIPVYLNAQEAQAVYFAIVARAQKLWVQDYMTYKSMIEACTTAEEVNAIVIDYDNVPVIQVPEAPEEPTEETTEESSDVEEEHENKPDKTTPDTGVQEVQEDTAGEIE